MISENCRIDEFVETVKNKTSWEALSLAVEEANRADRMAYRSERKTDFQTYSRQLKRLIGYLRYSVTPRRPRDMAYRLYMQHWGSARELHPSVLAGQPMDRAMQSIN
ncbi:hypothetical protein DSCW_57930 [Desulfosarcina widdelii]|uniref:Uncharacterized protein n=1 Tax=Desulfosarcina widdelii TaxID=947919 RepID=A0A5K7Z959_9BACT|nr:hypothetical protein [Desulfosarcina widdelii]BBO78376.1 hypothetical protein DSCW_57930 [Desulfosarcina widdelii]